MKNLAGTILQVLALTILLAPMGCKKATQTGKLGVRLQDAPAQGSSSPYDEVNIDLQAVQVYYTGQGSSYTGWSTMHTNADIYNLLSLTDNSIATVAWDDKLVLGRISQVKLVLGSNNYVIDHGVKRTMNVPPGAENGLILDFVADITAKHEINLLIDFDAQKSVVVNTDGSLSLVPQMYIAGKLSM